MAEITDEEIIERVEKWFPKAKAYWEPHHTRFTTIKKFVRNHGDHAQWDDQEWNDRTGTTPARLTLTENLLGPFVNQVANDLKQSDFGAQVKPKDSGTDIKLAETRQGFHRGIQQIGGFKNALSRAIDDLIDGGLGCWRFITRNTDPMSFQKEIEYLESDPVRLFHGDGTHRKSDFSDVTDSLYFQPYSKEAFKVDFEKDPDLFLGKNDCSPVWGTQSTGPWVSEYLFKQESPETLIKCTEEPAALPILEAAKVRPGASYYLSDFKSKMQETADTVGLKVESFIAKDANGDSITRSTTSCQVWWAKLAGKEVLKKEKWPGYWIPNFLATGRMVSTNGDVKYYGLAEPAVHVQKAHNFAFSAMVERAGQAPKSQIMMPIEGMDAKYQKIYDNLATWNGVVPYKSRDSKGNAIDRPTKEAPIQSDPAFINLRQMTLQGIRDVLGMWETSLGAQSNEKSGVAINARERQADTGNYDWGANLAKPAEHCFRATDEIANKVYDVATQIRIVGEDEKESVIWAASLEEGDPNPNGYFDLNRGKYDIYCKMSPSADTKREDQVRGMEMLFQNNPQLAAGLAPDYIAIQDWKNAQKMAEVAKKIRAAQFPNVNFEEGQAQIPPEVQAQMGQMQQQNQALQQQMQEMQKEVQQAQQVKMENQAIKADKSNDSQRLLIEKFKADTDRMKVQADIRVQQGKMLLAADDQKHDQTLENSKAIQDAHAQDHSQLHDNAKAVQDAHGQAHQTQMDHKNFEQTAANSERDHALQVSAQKAASEPAQPGKSAPPKA